ncbi:AMP-activated serine/threonine-protein kinase regulatory subunit [Aspergillus melleus]|uniref:AMP-activated serine/threonine-protein kinase regulatory subunit n=1 Tax=Aspergillus melleus TaxID=138277 RepID=UPI001E8DBE6A|nr:AMP-activated serine/threonine-protein kinase regulatory subunit [Aspergillus melleus]KAH8427234.1 AMP-activated serine/threonine-protein kinase regulatory subunit [Aspergillus melleus]
MTAGEDPTGRTSASPPPQPAATDDIHSSTTSSSTTTPITASFHHHQIRSSFPDCQSVRGHEGFVQPSSYLRPRGLSHPMAPAQPERAIDREERQGLVSLSLFSFLSFAFFFWTSSLFPALRALLRRAFLFDYCYFYLSVFSFSRVSLHLPSPLHAPHLVLWSCRGLRFSSASTHSSTSHGILESRAN